MDDRSLEILAVLRRKSDTPLESCPSVITCDEIADLIERLAAENARLQERIGKLEDAIAKMFDASEAEIERWAKALDEALEWVETLGERLKAYDGQEEDLPDLDALDPRKQEGE